MFFSIIIFYLISYFLFLTYISFPNVLTKYEIRSLSACIIQEITNQIQDEYLLLNIVLPIYNNY